MINSLKKLASAFQQFKIPSSELDELIAFAAEIKLPQAGDEAKIRFGPYTEMRGKVLDINEKTRIADLEMSIFGRKITKQFPISDLEFLNSPNSPVFNPNDYDLDQMDEKQLKFFEEELKKYIESEESNWVVLLKFFTKYPEYLNPNVVDCYELLRYIIYTPSVAKNDEINLSGEVVFNIYNFLNEEQQKDIQSITASEIISPNPDRVMEYLPNFAGRMLALVLERNPILYFEYPKYQEVYIAEPEVMAYKALIKNPSRFLKAELDKVYPDFAETTGDHTPSREIAIKAILNQGDLKDIRKVLEMEPSFYKNPAILNVVSGDQLSSFLRLHLPNNILSDEGKDFLDRLAQKLIDEGNYNAFFYLNNFLIQDFKYKWFNDDAFKLAKELFEKDPMAAYEAGVYDYFPQFSYKAGDRVAVKDFYYVDDEFFTRDLSKSGNVGVIIHFDQNSGNMTVKLDESGETINVGIDDVYMAPNPAPDNSWMGHGF